MSAACINVTHSVSDFVVVQGNQSSLTSTECYSLPLEYVPDHLNDLMTVQFSTSELKLAALLSIEGKKNISFIGFDGGTKISCFQANKSNYSSIGAGLAFISVKNLTLANLTFENCGALHNSTANFQINNSVTTFRRSSIYILNCANISIVNVSVKHSCGTGVTFSNTFGTVNVEYSHFDGNRVPVSEASIYSGGSGVHIEFTHCKQMTNYTFQACSFLNNNASTLDTENVPAFWYASSDFQGMGRGGGMCIYLKAQTEMVTINITRSVFQRNSAVWGGGLYLGLLDNPSNNTIYISNTQFESNNGSNTGGGIKINYMFAEGVNNFMSFQNCNFTSNTAEFGGGVVFYSNQRYPTSADLNNKIQFLDCAWSSNTAHYGAAVDIEPPIWDMHSTGLPVPVFRNCRFISNWVIDEKMSKCELCLQTKNGKGTFAATGYSIQFGGTVHFENNTGSAIHITSSSMEFAAGTDAVFVDNSGISGGAIALLASSIWVHENCAFTFANNSALLRGGAIFAYSVNTQDYVSLHRCFIRYIGYENTAIHDETNVTFSFTENKIGSESQVATGNQYGTSIFASTLYPCYRYCSRESSSRGAYNIGNPFQCIGKFTYNNNEIQNSTQEVSTCTRQFKINQNEHFPFMVIPGKTFVLPITLEDDFENEVPEVYHVTVHNNGNSKISVDRAFAYPKDKGILLFGNTSDQGSLLLTKRGFRDVSLSLAVHMTQCPPGYIFSNDSLQCICSTSSNCAYEGILKCNLRRFHAYIQYGYWIGYDNNINETEYSLLTGYCPFRFCFPEENTSSHFSLPGTASRETLDRLVCGPRRTGILCSKCRTNYSVYFHSGRYDCKRNELCKIGWLLYILAELLPLTVLFVLVIAFNVTFTSGNANGFVFFAQVLDSLHITLHGDYPSSPKAIRLLTVVHTFIYRFFNLGFFDADPLSFCLWEGASMLDILTFKFVTVAYALLLVLVTVKLMNTCNFYRWCPSLRGSSVKSSIIHGLSAFLVMCYAQCTRNSLYILDSERLTSKGHMIIRNVVYRQGDVVYFSRDHLPYAIPAMVCIATIVAIPPILLLIYPVCYKLLALLRLDDSKFFHFTSKFIPLSKFKPLLDSFQSCFKDNCRFYAGLYFLYRFIILATASFTTSFTLTYTIIEIELILFLSFHALAQPYVKQWHNILDTLLFTNLAVINALSLYSYTRQPVDHQKVISSIKLVLIFLPIVYMVGYVIFCLLPKIKGILLMLTRRHERTPSTCSQPQDANEIELPARLIHSDSSDSEKECSEYHEFHDNNESTYTY